MPEIAINDEEKKKEKEQFEADKKLVDKLMDPENNLENITKEQFKELMKQENVFEGVANKIFVLHNQRNR